MLIVLPVKWGLSGSLGFRMEFEWMKLARMDVVLGGILNPTPVASWLPVHCLRRWSLRRDGRMLDLDLVFGAWNF